MMQTTIRRTVTGASLAALALTAAACGDSSTAPGGEQELITRVTLSVTPQGGGSTQTAFIDDPDGNGPISPLPQNGALTFVSGTTYTGTILFENRLENPPENITEEVEEEADEHQVYYVVSGTATTFTVTDTDNNGRPLGLQYTVTPGATTGPGTVRVVLCHYDDVAKPASGNSCIGDTDIDVTFNFTVVAPTLRDQR